MKFTFRQSFLALWLIFCVLIISKPARAQVRPVNDYGALGIGRLLKQINTTASVMMIGAHPDDEDSALLAYLARGENARTAYLSLTRGDGGQNIIGPELFESLGVIRTEELLQARRLDGGEQYFTRAYDYGFSKTLDEAKAKWPEEAIKCDVVRAIRTFRPMVVISRFSGTPADGHGQHQYAGYITPLAVEAAADARQCSQSGMPFQVLKLYSGNTNRPTLRINTGQFDTLLGRSYAEIAIEGRSQHRSQGEGRIEVRGERFSGLNLVNSIVPKVEKETSIFDGIDTSVTGMPAIAGTVHPELANDLEAIRKSGEMALHDFRPIDPTAISTTLFAGLRAIRSARAEVLRMSSDGGTEDPIDGYLAQKEAEYSKIILAVYGISIDALADKETVVPGEDLLASVNLYFPKDQTVMVKDMRMKVPKDWRAMHVDSPPAGPQGFFGRDTPNRSDFYAVKVSQNAEPTQPYWLRDARDGDLFRWPDDEDRTLPFEPQSIVAQVKIELNGTEINIDKPVQYRYADPARGEIRREVNVVPQLSVSVDNALLIVSQNDRPQTRKILVNVTNNSSSPAKGIPGLNIPTEAEWKISAASREVSLKSRGEKTSVGFEVTIPAKIKPGIHYIYPSVAVGESLASQTMNVIAYPHIQTHRFYTRAETKVNVVDLKVAPVRVGYVMGSGDDVPEAMRQMGFNVTMLDEKALASGDLTNFDTIVVGIRASETRPDFVSNFGRLTDYMKNGGNLIMQYQRGNFAKSGLTPYPVDTEDKQKTAAGSIARVVDENSKVTILDPKHSVFNFPNKITDKDFDGWLQERNAYSLVTFDPQYTPLLESHDAGEAENKGGLVIAKVGKGNYIYCSYSMFRQLPAGVPGAYRLFANLVSLPKAAKK